ncbi:glycosyltransferase family 4 protein [Lysinibacillus sp. NPDC097214]|uniref:glycosyltransferase family 4 protein n=1 Tax=Lysinibacillus sp. NPDC097214 TaxID=3390584 RepID=UPI003D052AE3
MRILHWDEMFHPSFGYQINILPKYQVKQGHEVIIVTSEEIEKHPTFSKFGGSVNIEQEDMKYMNMYGVKIIRLPIHTVMSGRVIYKKGYLKIIKELEPDVIMCHTNDTLSAIRITQHYKYFNTPIVFDNHMLEMASKNPLSKLFRLYFKSFITPIIKKNNLTVIRTQNDNYVNKHLGIPEKQTPFISFGSDRSLFYPNIQEKKTFRDKYNINMEDFVVLYTGKLTEDKGGKLLANAFYKKFDTEKNIILVVVGNASGEYGNEVEELFRKSDNRVIRFPTQKYTDLPKFYQMADLCLFPKQCSLSFYDAQSCGLPVIAENNNVNIDRLSHNNGFTFKTDDMEDFRDNVLKFIKLSDEEYKVISNNAYKFVKDNYDYEELTKQYNDILLNEYEKFQKRSF